MGDEPKRENLDDFFEALFGFRPNKRGTGYELLVAAVIKIAQGRKKLAPAKVMADQFVRGERSGTTYQIDALIDAGEKAFVEAKDYTERAAPVGRGDVQKLAGALLDLSIDAGLLASATGFTKPSQRYAAAMETSEDAKTIELVNVRAATEADDAGRIIRFVVHVALRYLAFHQGTMRADFPEDARTVVGDEGARIPIDTVYRADGTVLETLKELTLGLSADLAKVGGDVEILKGRRTFGEPAFLLVRGALVPLLWLAYEFPIGTLKREIVVERQGTPMVLLRFENGRVDTLITDGDLKKVRFADDGEVLLDGPDDDE